MKVLVLGGSQFVGRHIVETLFAAGHTVTTLSRGQSRDELPQAVERLRADRDGGRAALDVLGNRTWDVCIDVSGYTPRQVRPSAECLRDGVKRYVYVSAVSAYGDPPRGPVTEDEPLSPPAAEDVTEIDGNTYGPLKVTCESIVREVFAQRATILRPQVVVGPYDQSLRLAYWVHRAKGGGDMLAPGDGSDYLQFIDVRDLARFAARVVENDLEGTFNLAGPRFTWAEFMQMLEAKDLVWVPADIIRRAGLTFVDLPLYRPNGGPRSSLMHVSNERAIAAGLTLTAAANTVDDFRRWSADPDLSEMLPPAKEAELIGLARSKTANAA